MGCIRETQLRWDVLGNHSHVLCHIYWLICILLYFVGCTGLRLLPRDVVGEEERASLLPFHNSLLYRQLMSSVGEQYRAGKSQVSDHNSAESAGVLRLLPLLSGSF